MAGCQARELEAPVALRLLAITPVNVSITNQKLRLSVEVENPGPTERQVAHLFFWLEVDGSAFVDGRIQYLSMLPVRRSQVLRLNAITGLSELGRLLAARRYNGSFRLYGYIVRGDLPGRHEFEHSGRISDLDLRRARSSRLLK
jgi:hypothetical protein